jgi:hypothetical protein
MLEIKTHPYHIHTIESKILVESEIVIDRDRDKYYRDKESNVPDDPYTKDTVVAYPAYPLPASVIAAKA